MATAAPSSVASFEQLQAFLLRFTEGENGFISEVLQDPQGNPFLKTRAIANIAQDDETRAFDRQRAHDELELTGVGKVNPDSGRCQEIFMIDCDEGTTISRLSDQRLTEFLKKPLGVEALRNVINRVPEKSFS